MPKGYEGKVDYKQGVVHPTGNPDKSYGKQTDAWKAEADCGCGIDCCDNSIKLRDQTTGNIIRWFFTDGHMKFTDLTTGITKTVTAVADED